MNAPDRLNMEQAARKLRALAEDLWRLAPAQALKITGAAQELELRITRLQRLDEVRA